MGLYLNHCVVCNNVKHKSNFMKTIENTFDIIIACTIQTLPIDIQHIYDRGQISQTSMGSPVSWQAVGFGCDPNSKLLTP